LENARKRRTVEDVNRGRQTSPDRFAYALDYDRALQRHPKWNVSRDRYPQLCAQKDRGFLCESRHLNRQPGDAPPVSDFCEAAV
jgi:hypothetical protein